MGIPETDCFRPPAEVGMFSTTHVEREKQKGAKKALPFVVGLKTHAYSNWINNSRKSVSVSLFKSVLLHPAGLAPAGRLACGQTNAKADRPCCSSRQSGSWNTEGASVTPCGSSSSGRGAGQKMTRHCLSEICGQGCLPEVSLALFCPSAPLVETSELRRAHLLVDVVDEVADPPSQHAVCENLHLWGLEDSSPFRVRWFVLRHHLHSVLAYRKAAQLTRVCQPVAVVAAHLAKLCRSLHEYLIEGLELRPVVKVHQLEQTFLFDESSSGWLGAQ